MTILLQTVLAVLATVIRISEERKFVQTKLVKAMAGQN